jgi:hypothetical protein
LVFTFSEGTDPVALSAAKKANIQFQNYYTFNNLPIKYRDIGDLAAQEEWISCSETHKKLFDDFQEQKPFSQRCDSAGQPFEEALGSKRVLLWMGVV